MPSTNNDAVWFEISVKNLDRSAMFYETVIGAPLARQEMGGEKLAMFPNAMTGAVSGHLHQNGAAGAASATLVHLAVPVPLEGALDKLARAGGSVESEIITLPTGARFAYCKDIDGNRFGAFTPS
jgi:predicted enzyme related to lactoylglutathione lyase